MKRAEMIAKYGSMPDRYWWCVDIMHGCGEVYVEQAPPGNLCVCGKEVWAVSRLGFSNWKASRPKAAPTP